MQTVTEKLKKIPLARPVQPPAPGHHGETRCYRDWGQRAAVEVRKEPKQGNFFQGKNIYFAPWASTWGGGVEEEATAAGGAPW